MIDRGRRIAGWIRENFDLTILLMLMLLAGGLWAFAEVADEVIEGESDAYDKMIVNFFGVGQDAERSAFAQEIWRDFTALGGVALLALAAIATGGYLLIRRKVHLLVLLSATVFGGVIWSLLLKALFDRPRPEYATSLSHVITSSFPSGHSMLSAVVYLTLGVMLARTQKQIRIKLYFLAIALTLTFLAGTSRVYLGVHYPTDVLAGWLAGLIWAVFCWLAAAFLQRRGQVEQPE
jgi:undecaprenyl-diphosphatase